MEQKWYTITEVAKMLDVDRTTVFKWIQSGRIQSQRTGSKHKIHFSEINKVNKFNENVAGNIGGNDVEIVDNLPIQNSEFIEKFSLYFERQEKLIALVEKQNEIQSKILEKLSSNGNSSTESKAMKKKKKLTGS